MSDSITTTEKKILIDTVTILCKIMRKIVKKNHKEERGDKEKADSDFRRKCLSLSAIPSISLQDYLEKVVVSSKIRYESVIMAWILIDRLISKKFIFNELNVYLTVATVILISAKYNEDYIIRDKRMAKNLKVSLIRFINMESEILDRLDFEIYVSVDDYTKYIKYFQLIKEQSK